MTVTIRVLETQLGKNCEQFQLQKHCMSLLQSVLTLWLADKLSLIVTETTVLVLCQPHLTSHHRAVAERAARTVPRSTVNVLQLCKDVALTGTGLI